MRSKAEYVSLVRVGCTTIERRTCDTAHGQKCVEIAYCGICGTDTAIWRGDLPVEYPHFYLGHEAVGWLSASEPNSSDSIESTVILDPNYRCGKCRFCATGAYHLCEHIGESLYFPGGLSTRMIVPIDYVHLLPRAIHPRVAFLAEPLACAMGAIELARTSSRSPRSELIIGFGGLGWMLAEILRSEGRVPQVLECAEERRLVAAQMGYSEPSEPPAGSLYEDKGAGFDTVYICADTSASLRTALAHAGRGGTIICAGLPGDADEVTVPIAKLTWDGLTLKGLGLPSSTKLGEAVSWLAGSEPGTIMRLANTPKYCCMRHIQMMFDAVAGRKCIKGVYQSDRAAKQDGNLCVFCNGQGVV